MDSIIITKQFVNEKKKEKKTRVEKISIHKIRYSQSETFSTNSLSFILFHEGIALLDENRKLLGRLYYSLQTRHVTTGKL